MVDNNSVTKKFSSSQLNKLLSGIYLSIFEYFIKGHWWFVWEG